MTSQATPARTRRNRLGQPVVLAMTTILAVACNAAEPALPPTESNPSDPTLDAQAGTSVVRYDYAVTVKANANTARADLERKYVGKVISIKNSAGFAIMGLTQAARDKLSTSDLAIMGIENNKSAVRGPSTVSGAGWSAWSGGWSAWSGGWSAWSGGTGTSLSPAENKPIWNQIGLASAQTLAPQLGNGVTVAVIDTGIDLTHPAFSKGLTNSATWYDWVDGDATPQEGGTQGVDPAFGHGTSVAGIVEQVAPNVKLMPLRVLAPDGSGDLTSVIAAIDWAVTNGARIINLSLGGTVQSKSLESVISWAGQQGVIVVSSSGNTGDTNITYPARYSENNGVGNLSIGVGSVSTNSLNVKSPFSTFEGIGGSTGSGLEMTAPGEYVYGPYPGGLLAYWSGTSMAAPMVSGALALARSTAKGSTMPGNVMINLLKNSAKSTDAVNPGYVGKMGVGVLNSPGFITTVNQN